MNENLQNNTNQPFDSAIKSLNKKIFSLIQRIPSDIKASAQEIRIRTHKPVIIYCGQNSYFLTETGNVSENYIADTYLVSHEDVTESFHNICNHSVYSYQNELKSGFITVRGGHRVGISATALYNNDAISGIRDVTSLNVRIARQIDNAAAVLLSQINVSRGRILIAGEPSSGKTTIIRELAKILSLNLKKVAVIDERGELAALYNGIAQNDLGFSDILNGYKKSDGILQAIRALSPDIIICDELGDIKEVSAVEGALNSGVGVIATMHAYDIDEFLRKEQAISLLKTGAFDWVVILNSSANPGSVKSIHRASELIKVFN